MKKLFGILSVAILGGVISLGGYKLFLEKPIVIERTVEPSTQMVNASFTSGIKNEVSRAISTDFTMAAENTVHAVVHVKNTATRSGVNSWSDLFNGQKKYQQVGTGSGVIISPDGYIVTNNHVIDGASSIEITLNNQNKYTAELVGTDAKNDIALLKITTDEDLTYVPFANSDAVKIGEWVLAVGNPYNLTSTVTAGIVSAKGRDLQGNNNIESFIQTDAAVNPGNSGGALVNTRGELVGINTAISSQTGSYVGYSFAVPSNIAKKIIDDLLEFGNVQDAVLGIGVDISYDKSGVRIGSIAENSGAEKSGLKVGDIITKINNVTISKFPELKGQLTAKRPGEYVDVTVDRNGNSFTKKVKLVKRVVRYVFQEFNWELKDLTQKELKKNKIANGVKIFATGSDNTENSLKDFIITKVNDKKVNTAEETLNILNKLFKSRYPIVIEMLNTDGEKERYRYR
jgi:S1-C subfamily serine protease